MFSTKPRPPIPAAGTTTLSRAPASSVPALSLNGVGRSFRGQSGDVYNAVTDVSFSVPQGKFVSIVGPSGCGKSTVLHMVAGLMQPSRGDVMSWGEPVQGRNRHASYMFQQDGLLPWKSVLDNVTLGLQLRHVDRGESRKTAEDWLARVGLTRVRDSYPHQLSGGMRKRVAIAQNWIVDPDIILMDEPFSALDVQTRQMMEDELLTLWAESSKTVLFITHDLDEAIALSDEVLLLSAGPDSTIVGRYEIPLRRPRSLMDIRTQDDFQDLFRTIWGQLREEVVTSYERLESTR